MKPEDKVLLCCSMPKEQSFWDKLFDRHPREVTKSELTRKDADDFLNKVMQRPSIYLDYWIEELNE